MILLILASQTARITDMSHWCLMMTTILEPQVHITLGWNGLKKGTKTNQKGNDLPWCWNIGSYILPKASSITYAWAQSSCLLCKLQSPVWRTHCMPSDCNNEGITESATSSNLYLSGRNKHIIQCDNFYNKDKKNPPRRSSLSLLEREWNVDERDFYHGVPL
jgi:hypothetical protein